MEWILKITWINRVNLIIYILYIKRDNEYTFFATWKHYKLIIYFNFILRPVCVDEYLIQRFMNNQSLWASWLSKKFEYRKYLLKVAIHKNVFIVLAISWLHRCLIEMLITAFTHS